MNSVPAGGGGESGDLTMVNISSLFCLCRRRKKNSEATRIDTPATEASVAAAIVPAGTLRLDDLTGAVEFGCAVREDGGRIGMMFVRVVEFQFIW